MVRCDVPVIPPTAVTITITITVIPPTAVTITITVIPPTAVTITITITITSKDDVWCGNRLKIHSWLLEILSHLILMFKSRLNPLLAP